MIGVCLKWVDRRPEVDPLTGVVNHDARTAGALDVDVEHPHRIAPGREVVDQEAPEVAVAARDQAPHRVSPCSRHQRTLRRMPSASSICGS